MGLSELVKGNVGVDDMAGPVGIVGMMAETGESAESTSDALFSIFYFGAFIAVNLALMNMLPIPALDGGRIFLLLVTCVIEAVSRRKLNPKYEGYIHAAGMMLLLALNGFCNVQRYIQDSDDMMEKRDTVRKIKVGGVEIGGGAPVSVQTMCNTKTWDVEATVEQIKAMEAAGADIVRIAIPDMDSARARLPDKGNRCGCPWWRISTSTTAWLWRWRSGASTRYALTPATSAPRRT